MFYQHVCLCEGNRCPGTGVTDTCELLWRCLELNPGSLKEQPELLTELFPALKTENYLTQLIFWGEGH